MVGIIAFWTVLAVVGFALALAVQMRMMIGIVLKKALVAKFGERNDDAYDMAVSNAGNGEAEGEFAAHLLEIYPNPLSHLRIARLWSRVSPVALFLVLLAGRFLVGVI